MPKPPSDFDSESARSYWLKNGLGELKFWLEHIDDKTARLKSEEKQGRIRYIEHAELIFIYSAFLNRLAQISKKNPDNLAIGSRLIPWLCKMTGWPESVANAFWYCIRNPTIHTGRTWAMADYGQRLDGAIIKAGFRPSILDEKSSLMMPEPNGVGWYIIDWRDAANEITVTFDFGGLRTVAEQVLKKVEDEIRNMTPQELYKLRRLNERIPFYYTEP